MSRGKTSGRREGRKRVIASMAQGRKQAHFYPNFYIEERHSPDFNFPLYLTSNHVVGDTMFCKCFYNSKFELSS